MSWKALVPKSVDINNLTFEECKNFKKYHDALQGLATNYSEQAPIGYRILSTIMNHLMVYIICCVHENKFPVITQSWEDLYPIFHENEDEDINFLVSYLGCDLPLYQNEDICLVDRYYEFVKENISISDEELAYHQDFRDIMKKSRLGLYEEVLSSKKVTKFKELYTNKSISVVRSVPYYESGEIFLTRIVEYKGDRFQIHDSKSYIPMCKGPLLRATSARLASWGNDDDSETVKYPNFMKLSGAYWITATSGDPEGDILDPDHYLIYY